MVPLEITLAVPNAPIFGSGGGGQDWTSPGISARIIAEEQRKTMTAAVLVAKSEIIPRTPVNTGITRKAMMTMIYGEEQSLVGRVFNPLGNALPLEGGAQWTNVGPPIGPLRLWAQRKFGVDEGEATSIAFAVRRKLMRKGLAPRHMFALGKIAASIRIRDLFDACLVRITKRLAGK